MNKLSPIFTEFQEFLVTESASPQLRSATSNWKLKRNNQQNFLLQNYFQYRNGPSPSVTTTLQGHDNNILTAILLEILFPVIFETACSAWYFYLFCLHGRTRKSYSWNYGNTDCEWIWNYSRQMHMELDPLTHGSKPFSKTLLRFIGTATSTATSLNFLKHKSLHELWMITDKNNKRLELTTKY